MTAIIVIASYLAIGFSVTWYKAKGWEFEERQSRMLSEMWRNVRLGK